MARFRKNESIAAKRRVKVYVFDDDGLPASSVNTFPAVAAHVTLTGTHHATLTATSSGAHVNGWTLATVADGSGVGSVTVSGGTNFTFHYQSGVTTMANMVTALVANFVASGHTPADVLTGPGDTQGPLTFIGGIDYGWEVSLGSSSFQLAIGVVTNCTRNLGTAIDGCWQYEFDQSELNFTGSEVHLKLEYPGFRTLIETCDMNDAADFDAIGEGSNTYGDLARLWTSVLGAKGADFRTGTIAWKSLDGSKTRLTGAVDTSGRLSITIGDLTP